ncbi:hypothetical protein THAOC_37329, partial [Thalassiosira oceanica]
MKFSRTGKEDFCFSKTKAKERGGDSETWSRDVRGRIGRGTAAPSGTTSQGHKTSASRKKKRRRKNHEVRERNSLGGHNKEGNGGSAAPHPQSPPAVRRPVRRAPEAERGNPPRDHGHGRVVEGERRQRPRPRAGRAEEEERPHLLPVPERRRRAPLLGGGKFRHEQRGASRPRAAVASPRTPRRGHGRPAGQRRGPLVVARAGVPEEGQRFAPRARKEDVEATSDARTSVVELSRWLDDDPLNRRRVRTVRRGEGDREEQGVRVRGEGGRGRGLRGGNVAGRAEWLSGAFGQQGDGGQRAAARPPRPSAEDERRPHQTGKEGPGVEPGSVGEKKDRPSCAFGRDATAQRGVRTAPSRPSGGAGSANADAGGARRSGAGGGARRHR